MGCEEWPAITTSTVSRPLVRKDGFEVAEAFTRLSGIDWSPECQSFAAVEGTEPKEWFCEHEESSWLFCSH